MSIRKKKFPTIEGNSVPYEEWKNGLFKIVHEGDFNNWRLGEWLFIGDQTHGETYAQAVSDAGISPSKAMAAMYTYQRFPSPSLRMEGVKWSMHRTVAGLPTATERTEWLNKARSNDWSVAELKRALEDSGLIKRRERKTEPKPPVCDKCGLIMVCPNHSCGEER